MGKTKDLIEFQLKSQIRNRQFGLEPDLEINKTIDKIKNKLNNGKGLTETNLNSLNDILENETYGRIDDNAIQSLKECIQILNDNADIMASVRIAIDGTWGVTSPATLTGTAGTTTGGFSITFSVW